MATINATVTKNYLIRLRQTKVFSHFEGVPPYSQCQSRIIGGLIAVE